MSNEEESMNEFEQLLESVSPADPTGSPMQIMYEAGQQSTGRKRIAEHSYRAWKLATLFSSSVAAGLMVMLATQTGSDLESLSSATVASNEPSMVESDSDVLHSKRGSLANNFSRNRTQRLFDPMQIAKASKVQRSIDIFEDFEIKPVEVNETEKRYRQ